MAAVIPAVMMAGAGISALGAISQANAAQAASSYNATLREREAGVAVEQANRDVQQQRRTAARSVTSRSPCLSASTSCSRAKRRAT